MNIPIASYEDVVLAAFIDRLEQAFVNNGLHLTDEKWARLEICIREALDLKEE